MKRLITIITICIALTIIFALNTSAEETENEYRCNTKRDLLVLMISYPEHIKDIEKGDNGLIYLLMNNGRKVLYDDKKQKTHDQMFYNSDLQDSLYEIYPLDMIREVMMENTDPGRVRCYSLLGNIYGESKSQVEKNLIYKDTYYGGVTFNKVNGAADNLQKALNEIGELSKTNSKIGGFVSPTSGTFNYRVIQDTGQLSPHAFGIAIDLKSNPSDYWKWCSKEKASERIAIYPEEIVKTFEKYGFVWGGKWAHFDILHFEYRPEIILKAKYFGSGVNNDEDKWYEGCEVSEGIEEFIEKINTIIDK